MKLQFNIEYRTTFGEELVLNLMSNDAEGAKPLSSHRMMTHDGEHWTLELRGKYAVGSVLDYYYSVDSNGTESRHEWLVNPHRLELVSEHARHYTVYDHWIDIPEDAYLYSSAFTDCIARHTPAKSPMKPYTATVRLKVRAPQLRAGERLALIGRTKALGNWEILKALPMTEHSHNEWVAVIDGTQLEGPDMEFKFVVLDDEVDVTPLWEDGPNRTVSLPQTDEGDVVVYELSQAYFPIYNMRCAGTLVPVFSLRSRDSFGVGDFGDLKKMIDWVAKTRQRVLQILPINDTTITHTWTDSYPYSCISIFALHPQYADLKALPELKDEQQRERFEALRKELNALPQIDYERVNGAKTEYLKLLYAQEGAKTLRTAAYKRFFEEAKEWLVPYAEYCYFREKYGTADYTKWEGNETYEKASHPKQKDVAFYYYVQYVLNTQMSEAHAISSRPSWTFPRPFRQSHPSPFWRTSCSS